MSRTQLWVVLAGLVACVDAPDPSPFTGGLSGSNSPSRGTGSGDGGSTSQAGDETLDPTVDSDPDSGTTSGLGGTSVASAASDGEETGSDDTDSPTTGDGPLGEECSPEEQQLINLVNDYRAQSGLPAIATNPELCAVSHAHTVDLADHAPHTAGACTLRSWSANGSWSPCCYLIEEAEPLEQIGCMNSKPAELTNYGASGWEAVAIASDPASALLGLQAEAQSNGTLLNTGFYDAFPWQSIGASIHGGFAVVWVGTAP